MRFNSGNNILKMLIVSAAIIVIVTVTTAASLTPRSTLAPVNIYASNVSKKSALDLIKGDSGEPMTVPEIVDRIKPSVVGICTTFSDEKKGTGTGIIISEDGLIATNCHVVEDTEASILPGSSARTSVKASDITVVLPDKSVHKATVLGTDPETDLAVIDIDMEGLTPATFGDSSKVREGADAIAVGNPLGLELYGTVTKGIISALGRTITVGDSEMTLFQTDAAINPGNSGGPLCNAAGEVIGINSSKIISIYAEGIGFAIPSNAAEPVIADLIAVGYVRGRPAIGFSGTNLDSVMGASDTLALAHPLPVGILVRYVAPGSAASKAGLRVGDIVIKADGNSISTISELTKLKKNMKIGDRMTLSAYRPAENALLTFNVTLSERAESSIYR
jgi:serine protease Do